MKFPSLSIKSKLVLMLLLVALTSILIVGYQGLKNGQEAITERITSQLTSVRETRKEQIESYFNDIRGTLSALSVDHTTAGAMREFAAAYRRLDNAVIDDSQLDRLTTYYRSQFLPDLQQNIDGEATVEQYLPGSKTARYLQVQYISDNPAERGAKDELTLTDDHSYYSGVHDYFHPVLRNLVKSQGFYDLFLIDIESGNIVYSVAKETDFATSLEDGPYRTSNLARLYQQIKSTQDLKSTLMVDFDFYRPSYNKPAAFAGVTLFNEDNQPEGILAIQLPIEHINDVMTGNQKWEEQGLGQSGETYLVGKDAAMRTNSRYLSSMRSDSRELLEGGCYRSLTLADGKPDSIAEKICRLHTSVLYQKIDSRAAMAAIAGETGTMTIDSYHGGEVLSSYTGLNIPGMDWYIMAEMSTEEANAPVRKFQRELAISAVILSSLITFLAMWFAQILTRPLGVILEGVHRLGRGEIDVKVDVKRNDEFGELADTFNSTVNIIHSQQTQIALKNKENRELLENIVPTAVANRVLSGEKHIADRVPNVSILFTSMSGFNEYAESLEPNEVVRQLNSLVNSFDRAAERLGVEKIKTIGDSYMAACGLTVPRLDHAKRVIEFSLEMLDIAEKFNVRNDAQLGLRIGIHSGSVIAGVVGERKFVYDVWGDTVNIASRIRFDAARNSIMITEEVYKRLEDKKGFVRQETLSTRGMGMIQTYMLDGTGEDADTEVIDTHADEIGLGGEGFNHG